MLKWMAVIWWTGGLIIFISIALNGGSSAWVGIILCAIFLALSILDANSGWGKSDDPNDWSV
jgi:hypothetical protein